MTMWRPSSFKLWTRVARSALARPSFMVRVTVPRSFCSKPPDLVIPGTQKGGRQLAIVFTCNVCETRSAKAFTERAYQHGVVIVRCPGCQNLHLIADRLGYFEEGSFDLETIAQKTGQSVKKITDSDVTELSLEELVGKEKAEALYKEAMTTSDTPEKS